MENESAPNANSAPTPESGDQKPKLPYTPPKLEVFGDIRELTQGAGTQTPNDTGAASLGVTG